MYQLGEKVVYGGHGVCCVAGQEERVVDKRTVTYLVLEPLGQGGSQFLVPTHNEVAMSRLRPLLTPEELDALLSLDQISPALWIREDNRRKQAYRELISSGDRARILGMLRTLYTHRENQLASGKKVHLCDDNFIRDAEKLISGEIALVLELPPDAAKQHLCQKING